MAVGKVVLIATAALALAVTLVGSAGLSGPGRSDVLLVLGAFYALNLRRDGLPPSGSPRC